MRPPFVLSRETERAAVDRVIRHPAKRQLLYQIIDAVLRVKESGKVSNAELTPMVLGFEATDEGVWGRAAGWLAKLHTFAPTEVAPTIESLATHRRLAVRFKLCASLDEFSRQFAVAHLKEFLRHKNWRLRGTALNVAVKAGYDELLPDCEALLAQETASERQQDIRQAIALLKGETFTRDGWRIRKLANGNIEFEQLDVGG